MTRIFSKPLTALALWALLLPPLALAQSPLDSLTKIGMAYFNAGQTDSAVYFFEKIVSAHESPDSSAILSILTNLGRCYAEQGRKDEAWQTYQTVLHYAQRHDKSKGLGYLYNNMGILEEEAGNLDKAEQYFKLGLEASQKAGNGNAEALCYESLGILYGMKNEYAACEFHLQKALEAYERTGEQALLISLMLNLGSVASLQKKDAEALNWFKRCDQKAKAVKNYGAILTANANIAGMLAQQKKTTEALATLRTAEPYLDSTQTLVAKINFHETAAYVYQTAGQWEKAFEAKTQQHLLKDSLFSEEQQRKFSELKSRYEIAEKDRQLLQREAIIQKQRNWQWLLAIGLAAVSALALMAWRAFRYKSKANQVIRLEKQRSDDLLLNILPAQVADELKQKGRVQARLFEKTTVICADFQGFTKLAEALAPESLVALLDEYFQGFDEITARYGIEKIKTMGDAYLCVGGLPSPGNGTPAQAVRCALDMVYFTRRLGAEKAAAGLPFLNCRVGLHSGPVVAGIVGKAKFAFDIWGDTVNTAARMEQNSQTNAVNLSEATWRLTKEEPGLSFHPRGELDVKGKGPMHMFWAENDPLSA